VIEGKQHTAFAIKQQNQSENVCFPALQDAGFCILNRYGQYNIMFFSERVFI